MVGPHPQAYVAAAIMGGGLTLGCVFTPPPPLPGEERNAAIASRSAPDPAEPGGTGASPEGAADEATGGSADASAEAGSDGTVAEPELQVGMKDDEIRAYAEAQGDPEGGEFTLSEATEGLEGEGELWALFDTGRGRIECRLFADEAPLTVANFVGLARGLRSFRSDAGEWTTGKYFDGTTFHRVIPGFMIQGGDPSGTGEGNAGYVIADEIVPTTTHDRAGRLSMANRGPATGSSQFFITLGPTPHLDGKHTIFGQCSEESLKVADDIAMTPRGADDRPQEPEPLERVEIVRR